ncbi:flagellar hook-basal body complex protein [Pseudoduganella namucuonensis]|uniref:Flagellar hook protein FlgE n=1 Tax=Pseudoduganella namucuonensis TaxID=1035707 RepID=A0A1I7L026_9BURK|nr:flagellar hook-basal body complex protein [Pseudoduganella namucuonensis]SFV03049.1 flagellar hook protein FlgE [Pseudoduganella namucuonensis]
MFQQGLSGLNAAAKSLDVIGNNIANASTVGFKGSQAQFADLYANSLNGVSGNNAGIGVSVSRLAQQFTQGNIETTNNPLDISINGGGFFRTVTQSGAVQYSRNGQFQLDKDGTVINAQGQKLTGYLSTEDGVILQGAAAPIVIDSSDLVPVATTKANLELNLDSRSLVPERVPFDALDPLTYNKQTVLDVFDSLGNPHVLSTYYVKTNANTWDVYAGSDGVEIVAAGVAAVVNTDPAVAQARADYQTAVATLDPAQIALANTAYSAVAGNAMVTALSAIPGVTQAQIDDLTAKFTAPTDVGAIVGTNPDEINRALAAAISAPPTKVGTLIFDQQGAINTTAMAELEAATGIPNSLPFTISLPIFPATGGVEPLVIQANFTGTTQYGIATSEKASTQDGYSSGTLERFAAGADGVITGQYSNGKSRPLAQIVLANFTNVDGLTPLGGNAWAESAASGVPQIGAPNTGSLGQLRSSSVESSNVDLTAELVNMITAQRVYQANAQTIKTQDSVLQTLVNLR